MANPLRKLWIGKCTVYEYQPIKDEVTYQTRHELVPIVENEPCRLSHSSESITNISNGVAVTAQIVTLFLSPTIDITSGAVIEVTQHGKTHRYKRGSKPSIYTNHQEVILQYDEEYDQ